MSPQPPHQLLPANRSMLLRYGPWLSLLARNKSTRKFITYLGHYRTLIITALELICSSGVFASAKEIYQESGIPGFFQGVVPRITGEVLALVLASTVGFTVSTYLLGDPRYKSTVKTAAGVKPLVIFRGFSTNHFHSP
jgi:hypothetical protein